MRHSLRTWLESPRLPWRVAVTAVALTLPALGTGWQLDDHFQRMVMLEEGDPGVAPMEAFSVLQGDEEINRRFIDLGYLPWWTPIDFRLAFFRPLSLATTRLDYRLWPDSAALMHAQSLLWFAALVFATALLYRRLVEPAWVAGLAALLYALDDAHGSPAAWLANRNALLATFFGVLCLLAHDRWRRDDWKPGPWIAPVFLALGLASAEAALATVAYLFAYAVILEPRTGRLRSMAPYAVVVAGWAGLYKMGGYGASGSGFYVEPLQSPAAFAGSVLHSAPFSLMGQWTPLPSELGMLLPPPASRLWWLVAVAATVAVGLALLPLLRRDRTARFWALGMLLALVPISATAPSNRLLTFVGLGGMALLARFLQTTLAANGRARAIGARVRRALAWILIPTHLILAPLFLLLSPVAILNLGRPMQTAASSLGSDPRIAEQDLIIANTPDFLLFVTNLPTLQALSGRPLPRSLRVLSTGPTPVELTRLDDRTLRVELERGLFAGPLGNLFRDPREPLRAGETIRVKGFEAEVVALASDGSPGTLLYRFAVPLEDPSLRWVQWEDGRYAALEPPAVGETISLAPAKGPLDALGW